MKKIIYLFTTLILILTLTSCKKEKKETEIKEIKIVAPSGAPALSQVKIAHDALKDDFNIADYKINFRTVNGAEGIKAEITNKSSDIIIAPINLGVNLYNSNKTYKYAANITDGNIYLASTTNFTLEDLKTRPLVFFGQNTINEAVISKILEYNNIARNDITYLNSTSDTQTQLVADKETETIYLIAEPVLTAAKNALAKQNKTVYTIDVQNEFKIATSGMDFLQAGVFVKDGVNKDFVEAYLQALEDSIDFVNGTTTQGIVKFRRADQNGNKSYMTYVDPSTFYGWVEQYNTDGNETAKQNALNLDVNINFIEGDMLEPIHAKFDILVSNPPYIPDSEVVDPLVKDNEPNIALFGGNNGLKFYEIILRDAKRILKDKAIICFEHGYDKKEEMHLLTKKYFPLAVVETLKDLEGKDRMTFIYIGDDFNE